MLGHGLALKATLMLACLLLWYCIFFQMGKPLAA